LKHGRTIINDSIIVDRLCQHPPHGDPLRLMGGTLCRGDALKKHVPESLILFESQLELLVIMHPFAEGECHLSHTATIGLDCRLEDDREQASDHGDGRDGNPQDRLAAR
jgi:hypothetical protein